ncbi:MAG: DUF4263 domain-containing protein [Sphingobacteriales bacterium]|nr:MAG: DUF4263 domain-containing protein [Sphingobacteriales bacterium]
MAKSEKTFAPDQENLTSTDPNYETYHYCNAEGKPIFKTKEVDKVAKVFKFFPYSVDRLDGSVKAKRLQSLEFKGWNSISEIPDDFKTENKYGVKKLRARTFFNGLYGRFKEVKDFTVGVNIKNSFRKNHIDLNWSDLKIILGQLSKEKNTYDREKAILINNQLSELNSSFIKKPRLLPAGDLHRFLTKYDSFDRINSVDLNALSSVLDLVPPSMITTTSNFINSKEKINRVYIEEVIEKFEKLTTSIKDNEKQWQVFFKAHAWILSHLFPYEVILAGTESFVGGKSFENKDGRIVDFLFTNGFKDNYALLEFKTHKKELFKKKVYRKPLVYPMSDDFSAGITQCLDQKDNFIKEFGIKNPSFDPKCILVIGMKSNLTPEQKKCFELVRANQKDVDIVTFDELLNKLKGLLKVLNY